MSWKIFVSYKRRVDESRYVIYDENLLQKIDEKVLYEKLYKRIQGLTQELNDEKKIFLTYRSNRLVTRYLREVPSRPPFSGLTRLIDLVPAPRARKTLRKLVADQQDHVLRLRKAGRTRAAVWNAAWTWALAAWYLGAAPVTALISVVLDRVRGAND